MRKYLPHTSILAVTLLYAIARYNLLKGVAWSHLPLFVLNKAIAWSAVLFFMMGAWRSLRSGGEQASAARLRVGARFVLVHIVISLTLVGTTAYPDHYGIDGRFTLRTEAALLAGIVAAALVGAQMRPGAIALFTAVTAVHTALLGGASWFLPEKWPGGMPPITLLSCTACLAALGMGAFLQSAAGARSPRTHINGWKLLRRLCYALDRRKEVRGGNITHQYQTHSETPDESSYRPSFLTASRIGRSRARWRPP